MRTAAARAAPGRRELRHPSNGELSRALGIGLELAPARGGRPADPRRRAGRARRRGLRRLGGPRHAGDREHRARRPGRDLAADRELPRVPGRDQRQRADQPRGHPGAQVRRADGDALPGEVAEPDGDRHVVQLEEGNEIAARAVLLSTGAEYRRLPVDGLDGLRGDQRLLRRRPARGAALRRPAGRGRRRRQLGRPGRRLARPRRRPRHPPAPPRRPQRDDVAAT